MLIKNVKNIRNLITELINRKIFCSNGIKKHPWYANLLVSESKKSEDIIVGDKKMTIPEYAIVGGKTDE